MSHPLPCAVGRDKASSIIQLLAPAQIPKSEFPGSVFFQHGLDMGVWGGGVSLAPQIIFVFLPKPASPFKFPSF